MRNKFVHFVVITLIPLQLFGYSVLTHEAIIDATWQKNILPLLLEKYPGATPDQIKDAHAYAYGGCVTADMGFYPYGSKLFTNLTHYVRTGDLTANLLADAQNINEYAFGLGMLCHYDADKYGHPLAVNRSVPLLFEKDKDKYGNYVTYEQDPLSHVRTEFGFDILQTARGIYANEEYHDFIGFKIAAPALERAFKKTYGITIDDLFKNFALSTETFRWIIKSFFPTITKAAWASKKAQIKKTKPTATRRNFEYKMRNSSYYSEFGKKHEHPGFLPTVIAGVVKILPKVGPLKDLKIKVPDAKAEVYFIGSFDTVVNHYKATLSRLRKGNYHVPDIDYDTGNETYPGEYDLADKTYVDLLLKLRDNHFQYTTVELKKNILNYYSSCNERMAALVGIDSWKQVSIALDSLRNYNPRINEHL